MHDPIHMQFSENQIAGLKAGLNQIAQGCLTLIKVLSMSQVPETDKFPGGRSEVPGRPGQDAGTAGGGA